LNSAHLLSLSTLLLRIFLPKENFSENGREEVTLDPYVPLPENIDWRGGREGPLTVELELDCNFAAQISHFVAPMGLW
jgi:hypothetical protein